MANILKLTFLFKSNATITTKIGIISTESYIIVIKRYCIPCVIYSFKGMLVPTFT